MNKKHMTIKNKICLFLLGFENINMQCKGQYTVHIEAEVNANKCTITKQNNKKQLSNKIVDAQEHQSFTNVFNVVYQNEKIQLKDIFVIQTPIYHYGEQTNVIISFSLLKATGEKIENNERKYQKLTSTFMIIKYTMNSVCQYFECLFKSPYLSSINFILLIQPIKLMIQLQRYKNSEQKQIILLKKLIKKYRYNNYIIYTKLKKYINNKITYNFTLPKLFISGGEEISEQITNQENLLKYLLNYESIELSLQKMNYELISISDKNEQIGNIFIQNYQSNNFLQNKFKFDYLNKKKEKERLFISEIQYKFKYCEQYSKILKQKLKIIKKQIIIGNFQENYNNVVFQMGKYVDNDLQEISYPFIIHQVQKRAAKQIKQESLDSSSEQQKHRYIFIMAHGYQGSPDDFTMLSNFIKYKFKKSKYLIIRTYQGKMDKSISQMAISALLQVNKYLQGINFQEKSYRIIMIGHSMGGLILRSIANKIQKVNHLYGYISLGTPHLGYLQGIQLIIRAGINFFSNWYDIPCFNELNGKDKSDLHDSFLYKLSESGNLGNFKKVFLVSSIYDKYVSWHSARLENYNKDLLKKINFVENEMMNNILPPQKNIQQVHRIEVKFKIKQNSLDKMIGRTSHIKFLCDPFFIQIFINQCLYNVLQA